MNIFTLNYLKGFFKRNKKLFQISLGIFFLALIIGVICAFIRFGYQNTLNSNNIHAISTVENVSTFISIFYHNFLSDIMVLLGGLVLSIFSVFVVLENGFIAGMFFGTNIKVFIVGILPNGIFEYVASIFALTGAFIITKLEIAIFKAFRNKDKKIKDVLKDNKILFTDLIWIIIIDILLLLIAAVIENWISGALLLLAF